MTIFRHRVIGPGSAGDQWVSTLHTSSVNDVVTMNLNWADAFTTFWTDHYGPLCSPQTKISEFVTDQLDPLTGKNVLQSTSGVNLVGTGGGKTVSPRSCLVVSMTSNLPTRAGRGRMYLPSPDSNAYAATGEFTQGTADAVSAAFVAFLRQMKFVADPVIFHRKFNTSTLITGCKVGTVPGTQRRRTNKAVNSYSQSAI
jgi:hypothetical protein